MSVVDDKSSRFNELVASVNLQSVSWREISAKRFLARDELPGEVSLDLGFSALAHRELNSGTLVVAASFNLETAHGEPKRPCAEVRGVAGLRYNVPRTVLETVDDELAHAFANSNGLFNAWPYWRELAQTSLGRLGIFGIIIPLLRFPMRLEGTADEQSKRR